MFGIYSSQLPELREWEVDFGYLPYPKFDENQENYVVWSAGGMMAYPSNARDTEFTGTVIEALSAGSAKHLKDAFIEEYVEQKVLRDEDSINIYGMMRVLATYDITYNIAPSQMLCATDWYKNFIVSNSTDLASWSASAAEAVRNAYDNLYRKVTGK